MDSIILLVAMIAVFYFLIIRPENKRKKQAENMRNSLKKGERITTIGGLVGRIVQVNDATVVFETSEDRVRIEVAKWGIQSAESMEQAAAPKAKKADKAEAAPAEVKKEEIIDFSKVEIEPLFADQVDFDTFSKSDFRAVKIKACEAVKKSKKLLQFVLDDGTGEDRIILSGIHEYYEPEELVGKTAIAIVNLPPRKMMGIDSCGMLISAVHHENGEEKLHLLMVDPHIPAGAKLC